MQILSEYNQTPNLAAPPSMLSFVISQILGDMWPDQTRGQQEERPWERSCKIEPKFNRTQIIPLGIIFKSFHRQSNVWLCSVDHILLWVWLCSIAEPNQNQWLVFDWVKLPKVWLDTPGIYLFIHSFIYLGINWNHQFWIVKQIFDLLNWQH